MIQMKRNFNQEILPENSFTLNIFTSSKIGIFTDSGQLERTAENSIYLLPQILIAYLENIYIFENPEEIKRFLINNKDLIEILLAAPEHIRKIFGNIPICLELHHDPEEGWDELFIIIKINCSPEKTIELENKLFKDWFIKILDKVKGRLNFTEEFL